ncbi:MAG: arsenate reductase ArsC [Candidatus Heimdallarchaeaceae archaeon]
MSSEDKTRIIFICSHNSSRSQMAETFLRDLANNHFEVFSAGIDNTRINPLTIKVLEELNYDLSEQYSKNLSDFLGHIRFDIAITVCSEAEKKCPDIPGVETNLHWSFENPSSFEGTDEEKLDFFRKVRDQIKAKILEWLAEKGIKPKD